MTAAPTYVEAVTTALGPHAAAHADDLAELAALLAEDPDAQLGPAEDYAAALLGERADACATGDEPGPRRLLGAPVGLDLPGLPARVARGFDPEGPLLVPRSLGIGWDLNLGALAVRLHLVAPDDLGEDLEPGPALTSATTVLPLTLAAAAHGAARLAARRRDVPTGATGAPLLAATTLAVHDAATHAAFPQRLGHAVAATALAGVGAAAAWDAALAGGARLGALHPARLAPAALVAGTALAAAGGGALAVRLAVRRTIRKEHP